MPHRLAGLAHRLSVLRPVDAAQGGLITFPIGAVYAASRAQVLGFTERLADPDRWKQEVEALQTVARALATGSDSPDAKLLAVFYFNNALMRVDVGYERVLRYTTGSNAFGILDLIDLAQAAGIESRRLERWRAIRKDEVNALKHRNPEVLTRARVEYSEMVSALEDLVALVEEALAQPPNNRLQRTVMDKVPSHEGQRAAAEPER